MNAVLKITETLYEPAKAESVAKDLRAGEEDGWTYTVKHDPTGRGYSFIEIHDEDGEFVGKI